MIFPGGTFTQTVSVLWHKWLGRPLVFKIEGVVQTGQGQGGKIGARTANLEIGLAKELPRGLYTCSVLVGSQFYKGLLYYGINFLSQAECLEVHLMNFSGDLYRQTISVTTDRYVRFPKKFSSVGALAAQVKKDIGAVQI